MRTTIAAKLYLGFGVMAALMVGSVAFLVYNTQSNYESLAHNTPAAVLLANAQDALWQLRYGFPQFMVGDAAARQRSWLMKLNGTRESVKRWMPTTT